LAVRRATVLDIPRIVKLLEDYHKDSPFKDIPFISTDMFKIVDYCIYNSDSVTFVAEYDGEITCALAGVLEPYMMNSKQRYATDMYFVGHRGGLYVLKKFLKWVKAMPRCNAAYMAVSTNNERVDKLYELAGLKRTGGMYVVR